jgi:tyrosine-specific transport protein
LGRWGKRSCWILYIFLFTCLMVAHIVGGGSVVNQITNWNLPHSLASLIYVLLFAPIVYFGTRAADRLNILLMLGIAVTYLTFVFSSAHDVQPTLLTRINWWAGWAAIPVVFTAFGYQNLIPTLMTYMNRDVKKVRFAIIMGTFIPFVIYIVWALIILGIIPPGGSGGLLEALAHGQNAVIPLSNFLKNPLLFKVGSAFAFFALTTSFVGISVAYVDFLADGLQITKKNWQHKLGLCGIVFGLPLIVTWINPNVFIQALDIAGGIGVAFLLGIMPILMVWVGRYYKGHSLLHQQIPGGKIALSILMLFIFFVFWIEIFH